MMDHDDVRLTPARLVVLALSMSLIVLLSMVALSLTEDNPRLALTALERVPESGVTNPVTAVLLNFRGYDTLLEMAVLLLAVVSIWSMARRARISVKLSDTPVLTGFVRFVMPLMVIVAAYLLWLGADAPGGAFQGGAVLGGLGIVGVAAVVWQPARGLRRLLRLLLALGLLAFVLVAALMLSLEGGLLQYPQAQAKDWILLIESAATISIGFTLTALFIGGIPNLDAEKQED
ncbi:MAG: MnhB domain-containing protein [Anaerolineae bacterium]|nr:MnhB domain-containing protein [Anaerolineae bacterium]